MGTELIFKIQWAPLRKRQKDRNTEVQKYRNSEIQKFRNTDRKTDIQKYRLRLMGSLWKREKLIAIAN